jgi:hypothetical protein
VQANCQVGKGLMEVTMRASVVVVGGISCVGVECKWSVIMNSGDMSIFDFGCRSSINLSLNRRHVIILSTVRPVLAFLHS